MGKVLSRRVGESVMVGDEFIVTLVEIESGDRATILVENILVDRRSYWEIECQDSFQIFSGPEDTIEIGLTSINGNQVKIAFEAPEHIVILREELYQEVSDE